ncbi:MAG: PEP-CTERM sorting domain-containing protein [Alphaproteobacteria bacterium]
MSTVCVQAAPVVIDFTGQVDQFNPGPFTAGSAMTGQITLDDTVVATGVNNSFDNVILAFTLTVVDGVNHVFTGSGGRVQQFIGAGGVEFIDLGLGGVAGGTVSGNIGGIAMTSFGIDFRGADLFGDPTVLGTGLTRPDFSRAWLTTRFDVIGPQGLMVERSLDTVSFTGIPQGAAVSAPGTLALFGLGFFGIAAGLRRRRT